MRKAGSEQLPAFYVKEIKGLYTAQAEFSAFHGAYLHLTTF
jgi:hypothetical protein